MHAIEYLFSRNLKPNGAALAPAVPKREGPVVDGIVSLVGRSIHTHTDAYAFDAMDLPIDGYGGIVRLIAEFAHLPPSGEKWVRS